MELIVIQKMIHGLRGQNIMLAKDLTILYEVPAKSLNFAPKEILVVSSITFCFNCK